MSVKIESLSVTNGDIIRIWHSLEVPASELRCENTLTNGQVFHWSRLHTPNTINTSPPNHHKTKTNKRKLQSPSSSDSDSSTAISTSIKPDPCVELEWIGVIDDKVISLKQTHDDTLFCELFPNPSCDPHALRNRLRDYFRLNEQKLSLHLLYDEWSQREPHRFKHIATSLPGMRLIRQDPFECLCSFICSSNNNISRIALMLTRLRQSYGRKLATIDGVSYHAFPSVESLLNVQESDLRDLGFGYRASFITKSISLLKSKGGVEYLHSLRSCTREEVENSLLEFHGIGRKVASCIALFGLDQLDAIPVDTHVLQIAVRDYGMKHIKSKSLTKQVYDSIGDMFRGRFGSRAGWAHSLMFTAELSSYKQKIVKSKGDDSVDELYQGKEEVQQEQGQAEADVESVQRDESTEHTPEKKKTRRTRRAHT